MRYAINRFRVPDGLAPNDDLRSFHRTLPGYAPTPLWSLTGLASALGVRSIHLKDESHRLGLQAFKGLGASWALHRLQREGRLTTGRVATASEGNHGRGVAWAARQLGLSATVFMPARTAPARIAAIEGEGATVMLVDGSYDDAVRACAARSEQEGWQVVADVAYAGYTEIPEWIVEGYGTIFAEVDDQLRAGGHAEPTVVIIQAGVGGIAAAAVRHYTAREEQPSLAVVEPEEAAPLLASAMTPDGTPAPASGRLQTIMSCLNCGTVSLTAWPVVRRGADIFFTIEDSHAASAMRRLAHPEPGDPRVVAGQSGAAGLGGLLALCSEPALAGARETLGLDATARVLLVSTEGAIDPVGWEQIVGERP